MNIPVACTIAGSDSGGGAGIQADIKSMQANGVFAASVLTAITAQNTQAVTEAVNLPVPIIQAQFRAVLEDISIAAFKTGMLSSSDIISAVSSMLVNHTDVPLVVDPVMISKSGFSLLADDAVDVLIFELLPLATICTPNAQEAERLTGRSIQSAEEAEEAARHIHGMGPAAVLVKGGHLEDEPDAVDVLFDGDEVHLFRSERIDTPHTHGTGCTYASAIAANLARGVDLYTSIDRAKRYVTGAIRGGLSIGGGHGPTDHFWFLRDTDGFPPE